MRGTERDGGKEKLEKVKAETERLGGKKQEKNVISDTEKTLQTHNNSGEFPRLQEFLWECQGEG